MVYSIYLVLAFGTLATLILTFGHASAVESSPTAVLLLGSLFYLAMKAETSRRQLGDLHRLRAAYDQLDQQAKLIIRTDFELHRTQEELDRRLASLMSLHQLGQQLQVSLHPEEVYSRLDAAVVTNFGFSKGLLGICASFDAIEWRSLIGVSQPIADSLKAHLVESALLRQILTNPTPQTLHATSGINNPAQQELLNLLGVPTVAVAGVLPHAGPAGFLLLGRPGGVTNPKAEEELVAILTNQLAIAVENSALYKETWTSRRELERKVQERTRELAEANAGLVRLNKAKSDFVSAVSHELRTPLAAIKGYAALLGSGQFGPFAKPQGERIAKIEKHADLLTQLINNLLDIARIESGRVTMERHPIPVEEFLTAVQDLVSPQLEAKRIRYAVDLDGVKNLVGDPQHLQRVFVNLLSNAVKYTPEGGSIRIGLQRDGASILAMVSDTGCGIAPEDLPKLFQEFYRANDPINQQVRGTGLGLALVKRIIEAHQGRIWVTSEKGKGSTFVVSLPGE
jgi:signal transduction histidine kinase